MLAALKKRGADPCAFKSGPDYIDPMFHRSALQVDSHNLDLFLSDRPTVQALYARCAAGHGAAVCEGAMGFYDGQGLTTRASAWELADTLGLPVLLVVQPGGASLTLAAEIQGLVHFRKNSHISGILLNSCSEKLYKLLKDLLESETGLPVLDVYKRQGRPCPAVHRGGGQHRSEAERSGPSGLLPESRLACGVFHGGTAAAGPRQLYALGLCACLFYTTSCV